MVYRITLDWRYNRWSCSCLCEDDRWVDVFNAIRVSGLFEFILNNEIAHRYTENPRMFCTGGCAYVEADAAYVDSEGVMRFTNPRPYRRG